jgi:hypothetical protein
MGDRSDLFRGKTGCTKVGGGRFGREARGILAVGGGFRQVDQIMQPGGSLQHLKVGFGMVRGKAQAVAPDPGQMAKVMRGVGLPLP